MSTEAVRAFLHATLPHDGPGLYLMEFTTVAAALIGVAAFGLMAKCFGKLEQLWVLRVIGGATPIPVFVLLLAAPIDQDLREAMAHEQAVVALAGGIALFFTLRDFVKLCSDAFGRKLGRKPPTGA